MGLGIVMILCNYWEKKNIREFRIYKTKVSSNNLPVIQMYNYMHFEQTKFDYVFVKHIK